MSDTKKTGAVYQVGDKFVDGNGSEVKNYEPPVPAQDKPTYEDLLERIADLEAAAKLQAEKTAQGTGQPVEGLQVPTGQSATLTVNDDGTGSAQLESQTPTGTPLPDNFPKRAQLAKAGITTVEAVNEKPVDQLAKIDGVTPQTAEQIKQAVAALATK